MQQVENVTHSAHVVAAKRQPGEYPEHGFQEFLDNFTVLARNVIADIVGDGSPVWTTKPDVVPEGFKTPFDIYLETIAEVDAAAVPHYNCHCCRKFFDNAMYLVTIEEDGSLVPFIANAMAVTPGFFRNAGLKIREMVKELRVQGLFSTTEKWLGIPKTGEWTHFSVNWEKMNFSFIGMDTVVKHSQMILAAEDTINMSLAEYSPELLNKTLALLNTDEVFSKEDYPAIHWYLTLHQQLQGKKGRHRRHAMLRMAHGAHPGLWSLRNTVLGTLINDIKAGEKDLDDCKAAYGFKVDPRRYQRPVAPPSSGNIDLATKIFAENGLEPSIARRAAMFEDIVHAATWVPSAKSTPQESQGGLFDDLRPDAKATEKTIHTGGKISMMKLLNKLLPEAEKLEVLIPWGAPFFQFVTAVNADAPPILKWDNALQRNPVNNYVRSRLEQRQAARWNLKPGLYAEVTAILSSPHTWFTGRFDNESNMGAFLVVNGCRDINDPNPGLALFPEDLIPLLHPVRKTIEAFSEKRQLEGLNTSTAAGVVVPFHAGSDVNSEFELTVRVHSRNLVTQYIVNRYE